MRIQPISNNQTAYKGINTPSEELLYRYCGRNWGKYMKQAMSDLYESFYTKNWMNFDILVKTIKSPDTFNIAKRGVTIGVALEDKTIDREFQWINDYPFQPDKQQQFEKHLINPYDEIVEKNILVEDGPKPEMWPQVIHDTVESMIKTFKEYSRGLNK